LPALTVLVEPQLAPPTESRLSQELGSTTSSSESVRFERWRRGDGAAGLRVQPMEANWGPAEISLVFRRTGAGKLDAQMEWLLCGTVAESVRHRNPTVAPQDGCCLVTPRHGELRGVVVVNTLDFDSASEWVVKLDLSASFDAVGERGRIFGSFVVRDER